MLVPARSHSRVRSCAPTRAALSFGGVTAFGAVESRFASIAPAPAKLGPRFLRCAARNHLRGTFKVESGQSPVRLVWASPARSRHSTDSDGLRRSGHCLGPATAVTRAHVGELLGRGILVTLNAAY